MRGVKLENLKLIETKNWKKQKLLCKEDKEELLISGVATGETSNLLYIADFYSGNIKKLSISNDIVEKVREM